MKKTPYPNGYGVFSLAEFRARRRERALYQFACLLRS